MKEKESHCDPREVLERKKLARTAPRIAILEKLIRSGRALTVSDLVSEGMEMDRVTIYRTLNTLRDKGIVREIPTSSGTNYYEMACRHNPLHPHFYCTSCRSMTCLPPLAGGEMKAWLTLPEGLLARELTVSISGLCGRCDGAPVRREKEK
ncbi:MAG TPA: transcriptional repressor [Syntrophales bacterium]|nr:transcriptional repressor [Syntrophales bacterium]HQQ27016.1 transcriptional repressor [Syntrophales bacterium]